MEQTLEVLVDDNFTIQDVHKCITAIVNVMTVRKFRVGSSKEYVKYSKGQPMGAYASFPMLGFTQHILVKLATYQVYKDVLHPVEYAVVGDDLVIKDREVSRQYMCLADELKIPINSSKTICGQNTFEFCK